MTVLLSQFPPDLESEFRSELRRIADWWLHHVVDLDQGRIITCIRNDNSVDNTTGASLVYVARLLWFFSALQRVDTRTEIRLAAELCYLVLQRSFPDSEHGGLFWTLDTNALPENDKKQTYGMAFAVYALSEYYLSCQDERALTLAEDIVQTIESRTRDANHGGYYEAFSRDWSKVDDGRLGENDLHADKTMNTHLHLLEAYTTYHRAVSNMQSAARLSELLRLFVDKFVSPNGEYLVAYRDAAWCAVDSPVSFGHDIEASWLIWEATSLLQDTELAKIMRPVVLNLAEGVLAKGLDQHGALSMELASGGLRDEARVWWCQAEALVGFYNAWQLGQDERMFRAFNNCWSFIKQHQIDAELGEWYWFSTLDTNVDRKYKAGRWKGPYHNGRSMLEIIARVQQLGPADSKESLADVTN